jgi:hypothetical protein
MALVTVEVQITGGRIIPAEPEKIPAAGAGLLTILPSSESAHPAPLRKTRIQLPLIDGGNSPLIDPSQADLDQSLWHD